MKHFTFDDHWDAIKGRLKQRFGQLTDDDLAFVTGKGEELFARLRETLGLSAHDLNALLEELKANAAGRVEQAKMKAADLADDVRAKVSAAVEDVKAKGAAVAEDVKAQAGVAYEEARKRARTLREDAEEYVRQNPRESLVAALCAGFVAGLLIRR
jgi:ElaB/YqjD/DUF883 family membrane-anchored ribosome-binding protein